MEGFSQNDDQDPSEFEKGFDEAVLHMQVDAIYGGPMTKDELDERKRTHNQKAGLDPDEPLQRTTE